MVGLSKREILQTTVRAIVKIELDVNVDKKYINGHVQSLGLEEQPLCWQVYI